MTRLRVALVILLVWAAYWAASPWIDCWWSFPSGLQGCTFGARELRGAPAWGYWPNVIVGLGYLLVAVLVADRRRQI